MKLISLGIGLHYTRMHEEFSLRLENIERFGVSNCYGTALYLAGIRANDAYVDPSEAEKYFAGMGMLESPEIFCLAIFRRNNKTNHAGIVTENYPVRISHRTSSGGYIKTNEELASILKTRNYGPQVEYRKPRILLA